MLKRIDRREFVKQSAIGAALFVHRQPVSFFQGMNPREQTGDRIYLNYITDEGEEGVRAAFGTNYARLVALKKKYDPTNFFRLNPNIELPVRSGR